MPLQYPSQAYDKRPCTKTIFLSSWSSHCVNSTYICCLTIVSDEDNSERLLGHNLSFYIEKSLSCGKWCMMAMSTRVTKNSIMRTNSMSIIWQKMAKIEGSKFTCPKCNHQWADGIESLFNLKKVDFFWINRDHASFEWFVNLLSQLEIEQQEHGGHMSR